RGDSAQAPNALASRSGIVTADANRDLQRATGGRPNRSPGFRRRRQLVEQIERVARRERVDVEAAQPLDDPVRAGIAELGEARAGIAELGEARACIAEPSGVRARPAWRREIELALRTRRRERLLMLLEPREVVAGLVAHVARHAGELGDR